MEDVGYCADTQAPWGPAGGCPTSTHRTATTVRTAVVSRVRIVAAARSQRRRQRRPSVAAGGPPPREAWNRSTTQTSAAGRLTACNARPRTGGSGRQLLAEQIDDRLQSRTGRADRGWDARSVVELAAAFGQHPKPLHQYRPGGPVVRDEVAHLVEHLEAWARGPPRVARAGRQLGDRVAERAQHRGHQPHRCGGERVQLLAGRV